MTTEAHPCPVCLNVHGGEGLTVEALAAADWAYETMPESLDSIDVMAAWNDTVFPVPDFVKHLHRQKAAAILAALTERSAI